MIAKIGLVTLRRPMKLILLSSNVDSLSRQVTDMIFKLHNYVLIQGRRLAFSHGDLFHFYFGTCEPGCQPNLT